MWKRKHKVGEWLPWYRVRNYKGNLTEAEKRQFDAFRMQPKHPAAQLHDLPEEVQSYINLIECKLYEHKQEGLALQAMVASATGAALLFLNYKSCFPPTIWSNLGGVLLLVWPWFFYRRQRNKNHEEHMPSSDSDVPWSSDEGFRQQWELNYLVRSLRAERDASSGS
jgi:hypothetical protein